MLLKKMYKNIFLQILLLACLAGIALSGASIEAFGAIANQDTIDVQFKNAQAIMNAFKYVNSPEYPHPDDRTVIVPMKKTFFTMPISIQNVSNVKFSIQGKLIASKSMKFWPNENLNYHDYLVFNNCKNITVNGGGKIDGRGYHWWLANILQNKKYMPPKSSRPHLISFIQCNGVQFHDLILKNSPCYHLRTDPSYNVRIYNVNIKVNTTAQFNLIKKMSIEGIIPVFPLNTDGIDPKGTNHHIFNISCQNYDDVVVPKPSNVNCTENMMIQNITVVLGVGLSIGSVPPNVNHNCIRNITFRNSYMKRPLKGIYLKTNPGYKGSGQIKNILYENITMDRPVWWAVYLGPQQQKQPGGGGPGCMFYPYDPKGTCETQPLIDIRNVIMKDIKIHKSLLFPYVFRCNKTNPCTGIHLQNVRADQWVINKNKAKGYVCEFVQGTQRNSYPKMDCLKQDPTEIQKNNHLNRQTVQLQTIYRNPQLLKIVLQQMQDANIQFPYLDDEDDGMGAQDMSIIEQIDHSERQGFVWSFQ